MALLLSLSSGSARPTLCTRDASPSLRASLRHLVPDRWPWSQSSAASVADESTPTFIALARHSVLAAFLTLSFLHIGVRAEAVQPPWIQPAITTAFAAQSVLTSVTRAGGRLVAVGERGIVILSDDAGRTWRQANVPVSVTLCAVRFIDSKRGWAVGHGGVILATQDGGANWSKQLDGRQIPALLRAEAATSGRDWVGNASTQFEHDGPDKPFLDVMFVDAQRGWAVGGYGMFVRTEDGGKTWTSRMGTVENPKGSSLYAIATDGKSMYLAGEQGYFARAEASGDDFKRVSTPVGSSYFTMTAGAGHLVIGGLGGVLLDSKDGGASWRHIETGTKASIVTLEWRPGGQLLVGSQGGEVMKADFERSTRLSAVAVSPAGTLHAFSEPTEGQLVTVGFVGAIPLTLPGIPQQDVVKTK